MLFIMIGIIFTLGCAICAQQILIRRRDVRAELAGKRIDDAFARLMRANRRYQSELTSLMLENIEMGIALNDAHVSLNLVLESQAQELTDAYKSVDLLLDENELLEMAIAEFAFKTSIDCSNRSAGDLRRLKRAIKAVERHHPAVGEFFIP